MSFHHQLASGRVPAPLGMFTVSGTWISMSATLMKEMMPSSRLCAQLDPEGQRGKYGQNNKMESVYNSPS